MSQEFLLGAIAVLLFLGVGCIIWAIWNQAVYEGRIKGIEIFLIEFSSNVMTKFEAVHSGLNSKSEELLRLTSVLAHQQGVDEERLRKIDEIATGKRTEVIEKK